MMRMSLTTRFTLITTHGIAMLGLGLALFYIRATMTNIVFAVFGSIFAILLVATSFLFAAFLDWVCVVGIGLKHFMELRRYLLVSMILAAGGLFLLFYPGASVQLLCYFTAGYAFFLGLGKLRLAQHWECGRQKKLIINLLGAITICFSAVLVAIANKEARDALSVLGLYSMFIGAQMLLTVSYLYRQNKVRAAQYSHRPMLENPPADGG